MLNKVILMGRLAADPEVKQFQGDSRVARFRVAVDRRFKSKDGEQQTDFISVQAWNQQADFVSKYFQKGSVIAIVGRLQVDSWTAQDGNKRYDVTVVSEEIAFAGAKPSEQGRPAADKQPRRAEPAAKKPDNDEFENDDSNLPF